FVLSRVYSTVQLKLHAGDRSGAEEELMSNWLYFRDLRGDRLDKAHRTAIRDACSLAALYCDEGRWDEAAGLLDYRGGVTITQVDVAAARLAVEARLAAHRGKREESLATAQRAVELAERGDFLNGTARVWLALAEVLRAGGRGFEADAAAARAVELYE